MICPFCANEKSIVIATIKSTQIVRFRKCPSCGRTWRTLESVDFDEKEQNLLREYVNFIKKGELEQ